MIKAILILIRVAGILMDRYSFNRGEREAVAEALLKLNERVGITKGIVKKIDATSEDEIDKALRG